MFYEMIERLIKIKENRYIKDVTYGNIKRCYQWYIDHGYSEDDALDEAVKFMVIHAW